jgi:polar amino acid transport system substrate-binding protein
MEATVTADKEVKYLRLLCVPLLRYWLRKCNTYKREEKTMKKHLILLLALLTLSLIVAGCGPAAQPTEAPAPGGEGMPDLGGRKILIGTEAAFPPFEFVDDDKNIVGFEPDLMAEMCKLVNCETEWINVSWEGIFTGLMAEDYDVIMAGVHVTEEREEIYDFTIPYYEVGIAVVVRADEDRVTTAQELAQPGYIMAVQTGTTGEEAALEILGIPDEQLKRYAGLDTQYLAVVNGDADASIASNAAAESYVEVHEGKLKILGGEGKEAWISSRGTAVVLRPGDDELRLAFNAAIEKLQADGTIDRLLGQWEIE